MSGKPLLNESDDESESTGAFDWAAMAAGHAHMSGVHVVPSSRLSEDVKDVPACQIVRADAPGWQREMHTDKQNYFGSSTLKSFRVENKKSLYLRARAFVWEALSVSTAWPVKLVRRFSLCVVRSVFLVGESFKVRCLIRLPAGNLHRASADHSHPCKRDHLDCQQLRKRFC